MNADNTLLKSITIPAVVTGVLLLIPLIAMQFTDEVVWTAGDFIFAGLFLFGTGLTYMLTTRKSGSTAYRLAVGFSLFSGLFLIWTNGAVGIIGSEDNLINTFYYGVALVGIAGALLTRFKPDGMILTMFAMATGQALVAVTALVGGYYQSPPSSVIEIVGVNGFFITLFIVSALLFRQVAQQQAEATEEQ